MVGEQRLAERDLKPVANLRPVTQAQRGGNHSFSSGIDPRLTEDLARNSQSIDLADRDPVREIGKQVGDCNEMLPLVRLPTMAPPALAFGRPQGLDPFPLVPPPPGPPPSIHS